MNEQSGSVVVVVRQDEQQDRAWIAKYVASPRHAGEVSKTTP